MTSLAALSAVERKRAESIPHIVACPLDDVGSSTVAHHTTLVALKKIASKTINKVTIMLGLC
jgi:hypothetical protein